MRWEIHLRAALSCQIQRNRPDLASCHICFGVNVTSDNDSEKSWGNKLSNRFQQTNTSMIRKASLRNHGVTLPGFRLMGWPSGKKYLTM